MPTSPVTRAIAAFGRAGGLLRTADALRLGIHSRTLYALRERGTILAVARGAFLLADHRQSEHLDLAVVAARHHRGVVCLVSALAWHDLTDQIPHEVHLALAPGAWTPRGTYPPLRTYRFSGPSLTAGVERHEVLGVGVKVYGAAKSVADCFKFRNRIGADVAIEALQRYRRSRGFRADRLQHFAGICRVERVMRPYLQALL
ncbi:MAG: type IV toxin-antitoxin system AbiEi family antitoxin domain-containing protein [Gemmatimonadota bacterium]